MRVLIEVDSVETAAKVAAFLGAPATVEIGRAHV